MKGKNLYSYYLVLFLILALSIRMSISSSNVFRIGYLAALFLPLVNNIALFPAILLGSLCLVKNAFDRILVPTELFYYTLLSLAFFILSLTGCGKRTKLKPLFFVILLFFVFSDLLFQQHLAAVTSVFVILVLVSFCAKTDIEISSKSLSLVFLFFSLILCFWIAIAPEALLRTFNSADDMVQSGWQDPNYMSCALGIGLVVAVVKMFQEGKTKLYSLVLILTIVVSAITLLGLASRGNMLAVSVSIALLMVFSKVRRRTKIITIIALVAFIVFLYTNQYIDFLLARIAMDDGTGSGRTTIWMKHLEMIFQKGTILNWLFGFGQGAEPRLGMSHATHNDFITILLYYGFVGLFLLIRVFLYPLKICSKQAKPQIVAMLSYLIICSMSIDPISHGNVAYLSFLFYIILFAHHSRLLPEQGLG